MPPSFSEIRLWDLIFRRGGPIAFRFLLTIFGIALKLFFRRIELFNTASVPDSGGLIFILNHPNGLIDPALVFVALPRKISFLAKSTLFRTPVISFFLRTVEALPLYRRIDAGEDVSKNQITFQMCRDLLRRGGAIALFPEGVSHNSPKLLPAKTGAARIALGAASVGAGTPVEIKIVPVGLFYTSKTTFRSEALLHFGKPFEVLPATLEADGEPYRGSVKELTDKIEAALKDVTLNAESDARLQTAAIAERIFAAASATDTVDEKLEFLKAYVARPELAGSELEAKIISFDARLAALGLEPQHLSLALFTRGFVARQAFVQTQLLVLLAPLAFVGAVLHFPAYQLCKYLARVYARHGADDVASTVKVLAGMLFIPLTWLIAAGVIYYYFGLLYAAVSIPLSFVSGYAALYSLEEWSELGGWTRAVLMFLTQKEKFFRLFVERRELQRELSELERPAAVKI